MALDPNGGPLGKGTDRNADGTCATTLTVFEMWCSGAILKALANNVRYHVYATGETWPTTGDAAGSIKYMRLDSGESVGSEDLHNPQPGRLPWGLAIWGAAGGENILLQAVA